MIQKLLLVVAGVIALSCCANAQYYYYNDNYLDNDLIFEVGGSVGLMGCLTDLNGKTSAIKNLQGSGGVYLGLMYQNTVGVRLETTWGNVKAADSLNKGRGPRQRNLSFRSPIQEVALIAEFHPLSLFQFADHPPRISPYVMAGVGWFSFNPQAKYNGQWVDLQPLHTEGQSFAEYYLREPYRLAQANVPLGGGLQYDLSPLFTIRAEGLYRILFTDYLDDVSTTYINPALFSKYLSPSDAANARALYNRQSGPVPEEGSIRGNPKRKDSYFSMNLKLGITLGRHKYR